MSPAASPLRPWVLARLSVALSFVGSEQRRLSLADEAVVLARHSGDRAALAAALARRCDAVPGGTMSPSAWGQPARSYLSPAKQPTGPWNGCSDSSRKRRPAASTILGWGTCRPL